MTVQVLCSIIAEASGFDTLGFYLLAVLYLSQMIGSVVSPRICGKLGLKPTFITGFTCLSSMVFCWILPAYRLQLLGKSAQEQETDGLTTL